MAVIKYKDPNTGQWTPLPLAPPVSASRLVGEIVAYAGASAPAGWLVCDGAAFSAATYPTLAQVIPSLRVPDLRGRVIQGVGGSVAGTLNSTTGAQTHGHTGTALPAHDHTGVAGTTGSHAHSHSVDVGAFTSGSGGTHAHSTGGAPTSAYELVASGGARYGSEGGHTHSTSSTGSHTHSVNPPSSTSGSASHTHAFTPDVNGVSAGTPVVAVTSSYQPTLTLNYIIYASG